MPGADDYVNLEEGKVRFRYREGLELLDVYVSCTDPKDTPWLVFVTKGNTKGYGKMISDHGG